MNEIMVIQGRAITAADIQRVRQLIEENPSWHRKRLSLELCKIWDWRALNGQYKDMACRNFLLKLHRHGQITLPPPLRAVNNTIRNRSRQYVLHGKSPMACELRVLTPIDVTPVETPKENALFQTLLSLYHYLGYSGTVGESMKYMVFDRHANPLACLLFGSAAWKIAPRDTFLGWDAETRQRHLYLITNPARRDVFLSCHGFMFPIWPVTFSAR